MLSDRDLGILTSGNWLNDHHITASNLLLKQRYPHAHGLEDPILQNRNQFSHPTHEYVQIFNVNNSHWITATNIGENTDNIVRIYDSLHQKPTVQTRHIISQYIRPSGNSLTFKIMNCQKQLNTSDCGVFSIAFSETLLGGEDPVNINFSSDLRYHLIKCFKNNKFSGFPHSKVHKSNRIVKEFEEIVYCTCRGIDIGKTMVGCDKCSSWFHVDCVGEVPNNSQWFCDSCL